MIAIPNRTLWLPTPRLVLDPIAWMGRIRRGGNRIRGSGGGRTRNQDCCCDDDCEECLDLIDGDSTVLLTIGGLTDYECDCTSATLFHRCLHSNLNSGYTLTNTGSANFEVEVGTSGDHDDPGILIRESGDTGLPVTLECYVWRITAALSCFNCRGSENDGLTAAVTFGLNGFSGFDTSWSVNATACGVTGCSTATGTCGCCPGNGSQPIVSDPCWEPPKSCGSQMSTGGNTGIDACDAHAYHAYTPSYTAQLHL